MTLQQASDSIGRYVVYRAAGLRTRTRRPAEVGKIMSVGRQYVFVDYGWGVAATDPADLEFVAQTVT